MIHDLTTTTVFQISLSRSGSEGGGGGGKNKKIIIAMLLNGSVVRFFESCTQFELDEAMIDDRLINLPTAKDHQQLHQFHLLVSDLTETL